MSNAAFAIASLLGDDDCECVAGGNDVEVTVIRSSDGKKSTISLPLSSTLDALKDAIRSDRDLGPIRRDEQRLFHLGRELASGGRTLASLGIGKHGVYAVHLHSLAPRTVDLLDDDDVAGGNGKGGEGGELGKAVARRKSGPTGASEDEGVIDLEAPGASEFAPPVGGGAIASGPPRRQHVPQQLVDPLDAELQLQRRSRHQPTFANVEPRRQGQHQQRQPQLMQRQEKVVELLDSDSDDDDDVVEIVEADPKRRRRN
ncbi:hypothetical protein ACHAWF_003667 [Thalassiosira exigua]